jgi:ElaB/YqjD/DUF883 family membrane-anchored ribosome-binding protein
MIENTTDSPFPASSAATGGMTGLGASATQADMEGSVHRMAQRAHEAVDKLEQSLSAGSERMLDWQQEYGDMAREQVRASPLAAVGIAFGVGILFSKLFMR